MSTIGDIAGVGNLALNAFGLYSQDKINKQNYALQKEQFDYQKQLQQDIFRREDNAVQRRALDLQKAGLSQTLAAGGSANAGAVVSTSAPQKRQLDFAGLTNSITNLVDLHDRHDLANATKLEKLANIEKTKADTTKSLKQAGLTDAQIKNVMSSRALNWQEYKYYKDLSLGRGATTKQKDYSSLYNAAKNMAQSGGSDVINSLLNFGIKKKSFKNNNFYKPKQRKEKWTKRKGRFGTGYYSNSGNYSKWRTN